MEAGGKVYAGFGQATRGQAPALAQTLIGAGRLVSEPYYSCLKKPVYFILLVRFHPLADSFKADLEFPGYAVLAPALFVPGDSPFTSSFHCPPIPFAGQ